LHCDIKIVNVGKLIIINCFV